VRVPARRHLPIVTVADRAWIFARTVHDGEPLDWRFEAGARRHREFEPADGDEECERAVRVARALRIGFSSQDWIDDGYQTWLVDVNPAGQWLFLNGRGCQEITRALASWLRGDDA
jgi:hypothetical protein